MHRKEKGTVAEGNSPFPFRSDFFLGVVRVGGWQPPRI